MGKINHKSSSHIKFIDKIVNLKWLIIALAILFIGLGLLFLSNIMLNPLWFKLTETIGISLLPIGSFLLIYEYGMRKEYQNLIRQEFDESLKELACRCGQCEKYGLISLNIIRDSKLIENVFKNAKFGESISLLGVALADLLTYDSKEALINAAERGSIIKLLYLNPYCEEAEKHSLVEGQGIDDVKQDIEKTDKYLKKHKNKYPGTLSINNYTSMPKHFILIYKDGVYIGNYLNGQRGNRCPHFMFSPNSPIAKKYISHFNKVWDNSTPI
ncbi:MAG: hypothetical protein WCA84_06560 [Ignavibacteriaceae bacterium]|jgi:hypothetical protein